MGAMNNENWHGGILPYTALLIAWASLKSKKKRRLWLSQSRRSIGAWKCVCCTTAFFFCRRPADLIFYFFLVGEDNQPNQKHHHKAKYKTDTSANSGRHRSIIISGFIQKGHRHTICKATRNEKAAFWTDEQAGRKSIYNPYYACHNNIAAQIDNDCPQTSSYQNDNTGFNSKPDCQIEEQGNTSSCLLYTSDAADE